MLDPSTGIASVTLEAPDIIGIDDVVVRYRDGRLACYQVKHTRSGASLSFSDLVCSSPHSIGILCYKVRGGTLLAISRSTSFH